jgi:hypothetical protein
VAKEKTGKMMQTVSVTELVYSFLTQGGKLKTLDLRESATVHGWLKNTLQVEKATCYIAANRKLVFYPVLLGVDTTGVAVHWTRRSELLNEMETFLMNEIAEVELRTKLHEEMSKGRELIHGYNAFCERHGLTEDLLPFERVMRTYTNNRPKEWRRYKKPTTTL